LKLETAIGNIFDFCGVNKKAVPAVAAVFRKAGVRSEVPSGTIDAVLNAGIELKQILGIKK
jgi:hypothetical protein